MLSTGVLTTRHWLTSGLLVQEFNVCTAGSHAVKLEITENTSSIFQWHVYNILVSRYIFVSSNKIPETYIYLVV